MGINRNMGKLERYYNDPFGFMDSLNLRVRGFNLNVFQDYVKLRKSVLILSVLMFTGWMVLGFDSTPLQFVYVVYAQKGALIPSLLSGQIPTFQQLHGIYDFAYGKEMHYSAFVIYGLMFWFLSRHYDRIGIKGSKNVAYSSMMVLLSVAVFEFYWMGSFAYFQNQPWVVSWVMPQLRILMQNLVFLVVGSVTAFYMWADSYILKDKKVVGRHWRFNLNWKALALILLSAYLAMVWINWPFGGIQHITVPTATGLWTNSNRFPQTLYTIDTNPLDSVNAGEWFYVGNDLVHGWNTLVKVAWTLTVLYIVRLKKE